MALFCFKTLLVAADNINGVSSILYIRGRGHVTHPCLRPWGGDYCQGPGWGGFCDMVGVDLDLTFLDLLLF